MPAQFGLSYQVFESFFDRPKVKAAVDRAARKNLSKAGAFVRRTARTLIRKRKRSARPGEPPSSHEGGLRKGIVFAYEASTESVIVGPLRYNQSGGRVPSLLEFGGSITRKNLRTKKRERQSYAPHPFMAPALEKERPNFPDLWAGTVTGP